MLILGLMFASMLNNKRSAFQGTVPYLHFPAVRNISRILRDDFPFPVRKRRFYQHRSPRLGMSPIMWFSNAWTARAVIIIALIWRWTGYNMVFYLSGMQNIEYSIYEAAKIDGASRCRPSSRSPFRC